ncbi:MAG: hypothetical protein P8L77_02080 [Gammaproteobacteria bacterium]|nr:hypothetical protein [Gammaproteobacteria bacterium]
MIRKFNPSDSKLLNNLNDRKQELEKLPNDIMELLKVIKGKDNKTANDLIKIYVEEPSLTTQEMTFLLDHARSAWQNDIKKAVDNITKFGDGTIKDGINIMRILPPISKLIERDNQQNEPSAPLTKKMLDTLPTISMFSKDYNNSENSSLGHTDHENVSDKDTNSVKSFN